MRNGDGEKWATETKNRHKKRKKNKHTPTHAWRMEGGRRSERKRARFQAGVWPLA